jgi:hypothetical protein
MHFDQNLMSSFLSVRGWLVFSSSIASHVFERLYG